MRPRRRAGRCCVGRVLLPVNPAQSLVQPLAAPLPNRCTHLEADPAPEAGFFHPSNHLPGQPPAEPGRLPGKGDAVVEENRNPEPDQPRHSPFYRHGDVFYARAEELAREEFMRGEARGRLSVALDVLTDAMVLVGQHGVYCASERNPSLPKMDLQAIMAGIGGAKELVASALGQLNAEAEERRAQRER